MSSEMPIIDDSNEAEYIRRYKDDKTSLTENERISLGAHLLVKNIIELDIIVRERKNREDKWREERNKLSKEIPRMSGAEKEKAINRVKELKSWMQSSSAVDKAQESEK
jgi:seryl-tRNA synthetase